MLIEILQRRDVRDFLSSTFIVLAGCTCLILIAGAEFTVSSSSASTFALLLIASNLCGYLFQTIGMPPLLGSLISGIVLQNSLGRDFHLAPEFNDAVRTIGLCIILLISALEVDIYAVKSAGGASLRLTFLPGLVEAVTVAGAACWLFRMPFTLALSLGFMLAAVSPAVVVPGMLNLQHLGYGMEKGIPSLIMAAASLDDISAITGFTISIGLAMDQGSETHPALSFFIHGPLTLFLGIASGCGGGIVLALARFCNDSWQRSVIAVELGLLMTYGFKAVHFDGCGAVATLVMGATANLIWKQKSVIELTQCSDNGYLDEIGHHINILWDLIVRPLLFGTIGTALNISLIPKETILQSCCIVVIGLSARLPMAYAAVYGHGLTSKERLFVSCSWVGKATVQAALCSLPLSMIKKNVSESKNLEQLLVWGTEIMSTAILAIIMTAPTGLLMIQFLAPILLTATRDESKAITECITPRGQQIIEKEEGSTITP